MRDRLHLHERRNWPSSSKGRQLWDSCTLLRRQVGSNESSTLIVDRHREIDRRGRERVAKALILHTIRRFSHLKLYVRLGITGYGLFLRQILADRAAKVYETQPGRSVAG